MRILCVCTANLVRSPIAKVAFERALSLGGIEAEVASAGTAALVGRPPLADAAQAAQRLGLDITGERARQLEAKHLQDVDLVVAMTREHLRWAVALEPRIWPVAYTLKQLARRVQAEPPTGDVASWLAEIARERSKTEMLGRLAADDLMDPVRQGRRAIFACAEEIVRLVDEVVAGLWGPLRRAVGPLG